MSVENLQARFAMIEPTSNPYSFSTAAHDQPKPEGSGPLPVAYWTNLRSSPLWMRLSTILSTIAVSCFAVPNARFALYLWRDGDLHRESLISLSTPFWFVPLAWPGYRLLKLASRIHHAVDEQSLTSIADVLEAQWCFWRALGILVLLAIAAIIVSATYSF
jgi:hypothetical protein